MARKKAKIQKEWVKAENDLNKAIERCSQVDFTNEDLEKVEVCYEEWKSLLDESVKKISKWKKEKDPDRLDWIRYVITQENKSDPRYLEAIEKIKERQSALGDIMISLRDGPEYDLEVAQQKLDATKQAIQRRDAKLAVMQYGIGMEKLKGVAPYTTKRGLKAKLERAINRDAKLGEVNLYGDEYLERIGNIKDLYKELTDAFEEVEDDVDELEEEFDNRDDLSVDSDDQEYQRHLKELLRKYNGIVAFAKERFANAKKETSNIRKLEKILKRTDAGNANTLVREVIEVYNVLSTAYTETDEHIQAKIRLRESEYPLLADEWGILSTDRNKVLSTPMNRAFGLNYKLKALRENGNERLEDILEELVNRFDTPEAEEALDELF